MPAFRPYLTIVASIQYARRPQNCFIESFNATLRDECLNAHWFVGLRDAQEAIEAYPVDYNQIRPHSSRGDELQRSSLSDTPGSWEDAALVLNHGVRE